MGRAPRGARPRARVHGLLEISFALTLAASTAGAAGGGPDASGALVPERSNVVHVPLPGTTSGLAWSGAELDARREELMRLGLEAVPARPPGPARAYEPDWIVVFTENGRPVLPDLDHPATTLGAADNQLQFTFDSPANPWTAEELAILEDYVADFYPAIAAIYGPPAFDITVNIRKEMREAAYFPGLNEIVISAVPLTSLCHEMVHAFHDDAIPFALLLYEEGMARATEIAAYGALDEWIHYDEHHGNRYYDVYYDLLNTPDAGMLGARIEYGAFRAMLRYQLGGYAWAKPHLESPGFLARFNERYYAARLVDPGVMQSAADFLALAAAVQPAVEGESYLTWAGRQYVLRVDAPSGFRLHQTIVTEDSPTSCGTRADHFHRDPSNGWEQYVGFVPVEWRIMDHAGTLLASGVESTDQYGHSEFTGSVPMGYVGRMSVVASVTDPGGTLRTDVTLRSNHLTHGIFGVVADSLEGQVTAMHLATGAHETAALVNGAFELPAMAPLAGAFELTVRYPHGQVQTRRVTKDASDYYVRFARLAGPVGVVATEVPAMAALVVPNPVTMAATLVIAAPAPGVFQVDVIDVRGRRVAVRPLPEALDAGTHHVRLIPLAGSWSPGVHFLRVRLGAAIRNQRFAVVR